MSDLHSTHPWGRLLSSNRLVKNASAQTHTQNIGKTMTRTSPWFQMQISMFWNLLELFHNTELNLCSLERPWLTSESKDALDISCKTALCLLLHLVLQRWEGNIIEGQVKEQGLAWYWQEPRREMHQTGLLADKRRVQAEGLKPFRERLKKKPRH